MSKSTKGHWNRNTPQEMGRAVIYCEHNRFKDQCKECKNSVDKFLDRCKDRIENMSDSEIIEHHEEAQKMQDPEFIEIECECECRYVAGNIVTEKVECINCGKEKEDYILVVDKGLKELAKKMPKSKKCEHCKTVRMVEITEEAKRNKIYKCPSCDRMKLIQKEK